MATYEELVETVRDWANRDESVLPDAVIEKSLRYTADEAYRELEIPALEYSKYYFAGSSYASKTYVMQTLPGVYEEVVPYDLEAGSIDDNDVNPDTNNLRIGVPQDSISFIYLRCHGTAVHPEVGSLVDDTTITDSNQTDYVVVDSNGVPIVNSMTSYSDTMFNEVVGVRSFYDFNDTEHLQNYYTRKGGELVLAGRIEPNQVFELHYYRRLPALNAKVNLPVTLTLAQALAHPELYEVITEQAYNALTPLNKRTYDLIEGSYVRSAETIYNWMRDENEKALLFGALHRVFDYLQEDQQSIKYKQRFVEEIQALNNEENKRKLSAGQVYTRFNANNLI